MTKSIMCAATTFFYRDFPTIGFGSSSSAPSVWNSLTSSTGEFTIIDLVITISSSAVLYVFFYAVEPHVPTEKGKSWIVMMLSSTVLSLFGCRACYITEINNLWSLDHIYGEDFISRCVLLFFVATNVTDLALGIFYYRNFLDPLTAIFHHVFYLSFMAVLLAHHYSRGFILCFFMEIPTSILAAGSVFKECRSDVGFGVTFLICRLIFNVYLAYQLYSLSPEGNIWKVCVFVLLLHCYWFYTWAAKTGKKLLTGR